MSDEVNQFLVSAGTEVLQHLAEGGNDRARRWLGKLKEAGEHGGVLAQLNLLGEIRLYCEFHIKGHPTDNSQVKQLCAAMWPEAYGPEEEGKG